jgi:hypothetical protein
MTITLHSIRTKTLSRSNYGGCEMAEVTFMPENSCTSYAACLRALYELAVDMAHFAGERGFRIEFEPQGWNYLVCRVEDDEHALLLAMTFDGYVPEGKPLMEKPPRPESQFLKEGVSIWPFDRRRQTGPWSQRNDADVYGNTPQWFRNLFWRKK